MGSALGFGLRRRIGPGEGSGLCLWILGGTVAGGDERCSTNWHRGANTGVVRPLRTSINSTALAAPSRSGLDTTVTITRAASNATMRAAAVAALLLHAPRANATNTTFVRGPEGLNYPEAEAFCTEIGATIASIRSAAENELARTACGGATCWIGLEEIGGNAWTPKASQTWRWVDGSDATYTNWIGPEPNNHDGNDERNAIMNCCEGVEGVALTDTGGWYDVTEVYDKPKPLCRLAGELSFDLVHVPAQCQHRCEGKNGQDHDKKCCALPGKMSCADDSLGGKYQLVRTERNCNHWDSDRAYNYYCLPCEAASEPDFDRVRLT